MNLAPVALMWFRRDLRTCDNSALNAALASGLPVLPLFVFDDLIIGDLPSDDPRISFIYQQLSLLNHDFAQQGSGLLVLRGQPHQVFLELLQKLNIGALYFNRDYEPYARQRDVSIEQLFQSSSIAVHQFKDQVIFEPGEIVKADGKPYTVYTPFKNKWLQQCFLLALALSKASSLQVEGSGYVQGQDLSLSLLFPTLAELGFVESSIPVRHYTLQSLPIYASARDFPAQDATSHLSPHLRFGTLSVRKLIAQVGWEHAVFVSELIWREFFMHILYHFPSVVEQNFNPRYNGVQWRNHPEEFQSWCEGQTGYPMVDAGMRQLNTTGTMHNRVRMITASFLCKHLLIDWRWGEKYFAQKLLDYDLSANNGNWQWVAGTGCDAAPYFRIFNPTEQLKKFDPELEYIKHWLPEYGTSAYPKPIVEHRFARKRCLDAYQAGIASGGPT